MMNNDIPPKPDKCNTCGSTEFLYFKGFGWVCAVAAQKSAHYPDEVE